MKLVAQMSDLNKIMDKHEIVVIDFFASWCGPCKTIAPYFEELSKRFTSMTFVKCNCEDSPDVSSKFEIRSLPTFVIIKNGEVFDTLLGADKKALLEALMSADECTEE